MVFCSGSSWRAFCIYSFICFVVYSDVHPRRLTTVARRVNRLLPPRSSGYIFTFTCLILIFLQQRQLPHTESLFSNSPHKKRLDTREVHVEVARSHDKVTGLRYISFSYGILGKSSCLNDAISCLKNSNPLTNSVKMYLPCNWVGKAKQLKACYSPPPPLAQQIHTVRPDLGCYPITYFFLQQMQSHQSIQS